MPNFHNLFHTKKTEGTETVPSTAPSTVPSVVSGAVPKAVGSSGTTATHAPAPGIARKGSTSGKSEQTSEHVPTVGIVHAESVLKDSAEKLEKAFPMDVRTKFSLRPIQFSADINVLSQSIEGAIGQILASEDVDANQRFLVKAVTKSWVQKTIPYLQTGLNIAEVQIFLTWADFVGRGAGSIRTSYYRCPLRGGCTVRFVFHSDGLASQSYFRCIGQGDRRP
jgi:hypothetical protein